MKGASELASYDQKILLAIQAEKERIVQMIEERDKYWQTLMDNTCTVGRNFLSRCYECGKKHASGLSWEEAYRLNALFAKCFECISKQANSPASKK